MSEQGCRSVALSKKMDSKDAEQVLRVRREKKQRGWNKDAEQVLRVRRKAKKS